MRLRRQQIGARIARAISEAGLSNRRVALLVTDIRKQRKAQGKVTRPTIQNWVDGKTLPDLDYAMDLARALNVGVRDFVVGRQRQKEGDPRE